MPSTITDTRTHQVLSYVFVYGTLRRGEQRDINCLLPAPGFIGGGQVCGVLYDLGRYPGARLGGTQQVQGEVYQIVPELERQLDQIEEVWPQPNGEYAKTTVVVHCAGAVLTCLIYEVTVARFRGCPVIASGDWLNRRT